MYIWTKPAPDPIHIALSVQSNLIAAWYVPLSITAQFPSAQSMFVGFVIHTQSGFSPSPMIRAAVNIHSSAKSLFLSLCDDVYVLSIFSFS